MHRSWMFPHNAGTSTPISASLFRRAFKLHLLPVPPPPPLLPPLLPLAIPFVGEELPVLEVVPFLLPERVSSAVALPARAAVDSVTPLLVPVALGVALPAERGEEKPPELAPARSGEHSGAGAAPEESVLFWGVSSSLSSSSPLLAKHSRQRAWGRRERFREDRLGGGDQGSNSNALFRRTDDHRRQACYEILSFTLNSET